MFLTVEDLIALLRNSVNIANVDESGVVDPNFLNMSDEEIEREIKLAVTKYFPDVDDLNDLPDGSAYLILLAAKQSLYLALAVRVAPKVDLGADNNNYLKLGQRFEHYIKLHKAALDELEEFDNNGGADGITGVYTAISIRDRLHYTLVNYNNGPVPKVRLKINNAGTDGADISWKISNSDLFGHYSVYVSEEPIIDVFQEGTRAENKIRPNATLIKRTTNKRDLTAHVPDLNPSTAYFVAVTASDRNGLYGYSEKGFMTAVEEDEGGGTGG